jgi:hypothetical protein
MNGNESTGVASVRLRTKSHDRGPHIYRSPTAMTMWLGIPTDALHGGAIAAQVLWLHSAQESALQLSSTSFNFNP